MTVQFGGVIGRREQRLRRRRRRDGTPNSRWRFAPLCRFRDISPSRGEIAGGKDLRIKIALSCGVAGSIYVEPSIAHPPSLTPISPLEGEMPGRAERGETRRLAQNARSCPPARSVS